MLIDTHAHLNFDDLQEDLDGIIKRANEAGVETIINVGTSLKESQEVIDLAQKYDNFYATVGIHPQDGRGDVGKSGSMAQCFRSLKQMAQSSGKIVGIGECGLDYYLDSEKRIKTVDKDKDFQKELFKKHIELATEMRLPLIVHCRNGWNEVFRLLSIDGRRSTNPRGVFHSWTGNVYDLEKAMAAGFYVSFSGIVTFKNAQDIGECAKLVPPDRFILETDCPFLSPEPKRGQRNEPSSVKIIAEFIAKLRGSSLETIASLSTANAKRVFNI